MPLRYAYNTNGCAHHRLPDALDLIAQAGYDGVALTLDWHHLDVTADDYLDQTRRVSDELRARELGVVVETGARFLLDPRRKHEPTLMSPESEGRRVRLDMLTRALDVCAVLGGETVSFWSGPLRQGVEPERAWEWLEAGVAELVRRADARGVTASFEPEPGHLTELLTDYDRLAAAAPGLRSGARHRPPARHRRGRPCRCRPRARGPDWEPSPSSRWIAASTCTRRSGRATWTCRLSCARCRRGVRRAGDGRAKPREPARAPRHTREHRLPQSCRTA